MTAAEARDLLRGFDGIGGVEAWLAGQLWQVESDGWAVPLDLTGWRFRLRPVPGGLQVIATAPGGRAPVVWIVHRS